MDEDKKQYALKVIKKLQQEKRGNHERLERIKNDIENDVELSVIDQNYLKSLWNEYRGEEKIQNFSVEAKSVENLGDSFLKGKNKIIIAGIIIGVITIGVGTTSMSGVNNNQMVSDTRDQSQVAEGSQCDPSYPDFCLEPFLPDLDCADMLPQKNFRVLQPDPHGLDRDNDGIGCEG